MQNKHKLGSADISSCYYTGWQKVMQPPSPNSDTDTGLQRPIPKVANHRISNSFWNNPKITLKQPTNLPQYRTGTFYTQNHAVRFNHTSGPANCNCAAIWIASTTLSSSAHIQHAKECS
eukprot:557176-Pelagomonas_calceolata.AAC.15